jgi:N-acetylmuramoyl-L-alanine amidase
MYIQRYTLTIVYLFLFQSPSDSHFSQFFCKSDSFLLLRYIGGGGGSTGDSTVRSFQTWLNNNYSAGLTPDGTYGANTKKAATIAYQRFLGVTADGIFGASSKAAVKSLTSGSKGNAVHLLQGMLYCRGFNPNGVDGTFGAGTTSAVKSFQASKGLTADGIAGANTMYSLYN